MTITGCGAKFRREVRVQQPSVVLRAVDIIVAREAVHGRVLSLVIVGGLDRYYGMSLVALATELSYRLTKQLVVFGPVRIVAFNTAASLSRIRIDDIMFELIRSGNISMAVLADTPGTVCLILVGTFGKPVATQAGHGSLKNWMVRAPHELRLDPLMTLAAEIGVVIYQQTYYRSCRMYAMAIGAVYLLKGVSVEPVVVHLLMRKMARRASCLGILSRQPGWIGDVLL